MGDVSSGNAIAACYWESGYMPETQYLDAVDRRKRGEPGLARVGAGRQVAVWLASLRGV